MTINVIFSGSRFTAGEFSFLQECVLRVRKGQKEFRKEAYFNATHIQGHMNNQQTT